MNQLRVVHVITGMETGGAETFLCRLLSRLPRERFKSLAVSLIRPGHLAGRIRAQGIPVATLGMKRGRPSIAGIKKLMGLLQDFRPDLVQTWLYHADLLGLIATRLAVEAPLVWNLRCSDMDFSRYSLGTRLTAWACARLSRLPEAVIANSEAVRDLHLARGYKPRRFEVLENGFDLDEFRPDPEARAKIRKDFGLPGDAPVVGLLARFDPMKDHATFCRAAGLLTRRVPEARFLLCGTGVTQVNRGLLALVREAGIAERAVLAGHRADAPAVLAALDLLCSSSAFGEGFPNTLGEAMACGVPCAATDVGGAARIVGDTGRLAPAGDAEALARAMEELLTLDPEAKAALSARCRERIAAHFSLDAAVRAYAALYEDLAGEKMHQPL